MSNPSEVNDYVVKTSKTRAIRWDGSNLEECKQFLGERFVSVRAERRPNGISIITFIDDMDYLNWARKGDFIIEHTEGQFRSYTEESFLEQYDPVNKVEGT